MDHLFKAGYPETEPGALPYRFLFEAFINSGTHRAAKAKEDLPDLSRGTLLREYHTLGIRVPRQSFSQSATRIYLEQNEDARAISYTGHLCVSSTDKTMPHEAKMLSISNWCKEDMVGVRTLFIHSERWWRQTGCPIYLRLEEMYTEHPEYFHPDFSVVVFS